VAFDGNGNAIVVWTQDLASHNEIWASRFNAAGASWSAPTQLSAPGAGAWFSAYVPDLAVDSAGNAIVGWYQGDGRNNHFDVWFARYQVSGASWSAAAMISDGVNSAYLPRVAVNAAGNGLFAWQQEQGDGTTVSNAPKDIRARTVTTAGVWGNSTRINAVAGNVDDVYGQIAVAANATGGGAVLWVQRSGILPYVIHAAVYAGGWQASASITQNALDNCYGPQLSFDASGNAIAVWQQQTGTGAFGGFNRYVAGTGWGTSGQFVDTALGDTYDPHVAVDAAGNATVTWYRWDSAFGTMDVMLNRYTVGTGWGTAQVSNATSFDGSLSYVVPRVASNAAGQTIAVWGVDTY
jgi:hypothetical protein